MIIGIGLDIIEIERIQRAVARNGKFAERILTSLEQKQYSQLSLQRQIEFLAGRFAAKEAYAKARGTGIGKLSWHDIEVKSINGKPVITSSNYEKIHLSITHTKTIAAAQVIIESLSC